MSNSLSFPLCCCCSQLSPVAFLNLSGPSCFEPINEAAKLTNWLLNWPPSRRALLPLAFSAPPSPPFFSSSQTSHPTLSQRFRVSLSHRKVAFAEDPSPAPLPPLDPPLSVSPSHSISVFYVCVTTSRWRARGRDDGVSGGLIPALLRQTRLNSISRW